MVKNKFKFIQKVAGGGSGGPTAKAKRDFLAAAKDMDKETFLGELLEQWYPTVSVNADIEEEVTKARKRIEKTWFKNVFEEVGVTNEDLKGVIEDIQDIKRKAGEKSSSVLSSPKVGRNDPCLCGSGKKYKKCCGR